MTVTQNLVWCSLSKTKGHVPITLLSRCIRPKGQSQPFQIIIITNLRTLALTVDFALDSLRTMLNIESGAPKEWYVKAFGRVVESYWTIWNDHWEFLLLPVACCLLQQPAFFPLKRKGSIVCIVLRST
jgi:hypothetical protein